MVADALLEDGLAFTDLAMDLARQYFRKPVDVSFKSDQSPVTFADQQIETRIREAIGQKYPDHGIFGEEYGIDNGAHNEMWVIDPIDGTRSFLSGHPLFGFLLAYLEAGTPQFGIIGMPVMNEIFCGAKGRTAYCNGKEIHVSGQSRLDDAIVYINEGEKIYDAHPAIFERLLGTGQTRRFSYDCYPHALLALGQVDAVIDYDLKPYDFLALDPVISAAGGVMSTWTGEQPGLGYEGPVVSAATPALHSQLLDVLSIGN